MLGSSSQQPSEELDEVQDRSMHLNFASTLNLRQREQDKVALQTRMSVVVVDVV